MKHSLKNQERQRGCIWTREFRVMIPATRTLWRSRPGLIDERGAMVRCRVTLAVFLVSVLGALLGCGPEDRGTGDAPSTTAQRSETTARTAEETSNVEPPNAAEAAAAGIDE